jgi:hypothetical protein
VAPRGRAEPLGHRWSKSKVRFKEGGLMREPKDIVDEIEAGAALSEGEKASRK